MGERKSSKWYDDAFRGGECGSHDKLHEAVAKHLNLYVAVRMCDVGCGPGCLVRHLQNFRPADKRTPVDMDYLIGVDFSAVALLQARGKGYDELHSIDLEHAKRLPDADLYVFCEVLEHLENDIGALDCVRPGKRVIITLPDFDSASHVRYFERPPDVLDRYGKLISQIEGLSWVGMNKKHGWWLLKGTK